MPLTLRDLVSTPDLGLSLLAGGPAADRAVTWVHVSELQDPTPFMSGGELLLTTGLMFDEAGHGAGHGGAGHGVTGDGLGPMNSEEYVRRLTAASVVGVGFGTGLSHDRVPDDLVDAGRRYGLPILEVPRQTPFIAISRAVSKAQAADEYAAVTRTFVAQQALARAAVASDGMGRIVRLLARQLGGWAALLDPDGAAIAVSSGVSSGLIGAVGSELRQLDSSRGPVGSAFPLGPDTVSVQSVGAGRRRAFLAFGRPEPLTADDRHLVNAAVMLLTIRLEQVGAAQVGTGSVRTAVLQLLLGGEQELAGSVASRVAVSLPAAPLVVMVVAGDLGVAVERLEESGAFAAEFDGAAVALVDGGAEEAGPLATRLVSAAGGGIGLAVGLSRPVGLDEIGTGHRQAVAALDFCQRTGAVVASFDEIAMPGVVGLFDGAQARAFAQSLLRPLLEHDAVARGDLVNSLREWLAHHGQWDPSAAALGVHRHTLRSRMRTVEELLGRNLDSPGVRAELWLALDVLGR